ncbi:MULTISPECIES: uracil-xanthine permease family protein [unclassified Clostridium]|uniref:uracil-xanthine permease family protein n=1 Tax=unclassified Clostridium TaxID=2614128 RepID=UPI001106EC03|nr:MULTISPECIES: uracil-xanthine permease family protein [unclassified Clostridium]
MDNTKKNWGQMTLLGIQHVFAMFGATVLVPLLTGLDTSVALFCAGVGTILFHLITKRKVPVFLGSSFAFIGAIQVVANMMSGGAEMGTPEYMVGLQYATGGIICAGAMYLVLALLVKVFGSERIRSFFPPVVTGPIVITIGLMLAPTAISNIVNDAATGVALEGMALLSNWIVAAVTIITMMVVSVFAKGFFKMVPILFGIAGGYIASLIFTWCGVPMVNFQSIAEAQWVGLPNFMLPLFDWRAIAVIAPLAIVTFVEHIGDISANGAVVGQDFFKDPGLHRTLIGDGVATMFAGLIGGPANTTYSENTGVLAATQNYNPATLRLAAVFAIVLSLVGKFGGFLQTLPSPVMGGISIILFGMIASVGLRTLVENQVDFKNSRNLMIVAVMLVMGLGGAAFQISDQISISGVALSAIIGIVLNKALPERIDKAEK